MKSQLSEKFYFQHWDAMMSEYGEEADLEKKLESAMTRYKNLCGFSEQVIEVIRKEEAQRIANSCKEKMLKRMAMIKRLESGESSLGNINKAQEISESARLRKGFEFTCLSLREFKKKYFIEA